MQTKFISALLACSALASPVIAQDFPEPDWRSGVEVAQPGDERTLPGDPQIALEMVAEGFVDPINVAFAPNDADHIFVVERHGVVRLVENGEIREEPFLDIEDQVLSAFLEAGLYDVEFHPDFAENGYVYVHFAEILANGDGKIVRYSVDQESMTVDPDSARLIMTLEQPWANHNGGELAFGPDGYLYIGSGDGGWEGDPLEAGEDLGTLLGKLLRIDVNVPDDSYHPYAIPADNPFANRAGLVQLFGISEDTFADIHTEARPEIWAYGLRNPWKFHFDGETGDLYLPDVGQNHWEEINFQPADSEGGENYGWDTLMGTHCHPVQTGDCAQVGVLPVAEYNHDLGCSVSGLGVYRAEDVENLNGVYLVGDYCSGTIWGLGRGEDDRWTFQELLQANAQLTAGNSAPDGQVYVTSCNCNYGGPQPSENPPGSLWRVVPATD